jgi:hypothetical protein
MIDPEELRPHPLNRVLYGPPSTNLACGDIRADMKRRGFDPNQPLPVTADGRVIRGITRHAIARSLKLKEVPCVTSTPEDPATAEVEIERELVRGNLYRTKTETMKAREQRKMLELEMVLARQRMSAGADGGPSKSTDRVGKVFGESGKTVQRRIKVLDAIEQAETDGDKRMQARLTELLDSGKTGKALALLNPDKAPRPVKKVEVPRTFNDHLTKCYSENFEACAKAIVEAELDQLEANLERLRQDIEAARARLRSGAPAAPADSSATGPVRQPYHAGQA